MQKQVLEMAVRCFHGGLFAGTSGNLSLFDPAERVLAITPSGLAYKQMQPDDIVLMRTDGSVLSAGKTPSSEWRTHALLYEKRPDIGAIIHTHSPYATSFAVTRRSIPLVLIEMVQFLGGEVPVAGFAIPGTAAVGEEALRAMQQGSCCLLANHGTLACGQTLQEAYLRAVYMEDAAKTAAFAAMHGQAVVLSEEDRQAMLRHQGKP